MFVFCYLDPQVAADQVLQFLHANPSHSPVLIHGFSVGGYVFSEVMVKVRFKYLHLVDYYLCWWISICIFFLSRFLSLLLILSSLFLTFSNRLKMTSRNMGISWTDLWARFGTAGLTSMESPTACRGPLQITPCCRSPWRSIWSKFPEIDSVVFYISLGQC